MISTDCQAFAELLEEDRLEEAVATYAGPFLDGFHLRSSHAFEEWRDREARHLGRRYEEALEELARRAEGVGDLRKAAGYWERLSEQDPLNTRHISDWMKALASVGDPGNAIRVGEDHIALLRAELEADPPGQLVALLRTLKSGRPAR